MLRLLVGCLPALVKALVLRATNAEPKQLGSHGGSSSQVHPQAGRGMAANSLPLGSSPAAPHPLPGSLREYIHMPQDPSALDSSCSRWGGIAAYLCVGIEVRRGRRGERSRGVGVARVPKIHDSRRGEVSRCEQLLRRGLARRHGDRRGVQPRVGHGRWRLVGV